MKPSLHVPRNSSEEALEPSKHVWMVSMVRNNTTSINHSPKWSLLVSLVCISSIRLLCLVMQLFPIWEPSTYLVSKPQSPSKKIHILFCHWVVYVQEQNHQLWSTLTACLPKLFVPYLVKGTGNELLCVCFALMILFPLRICYYIFGCPHHHPSSSSSVCLLNFACYCCPLARPHSSSTPGPLPKYSNGLTVGPSVTSITVHSEYFSFWIVVLKRSELLGLPEWDEFKSSLECKIHTDTNL